MTSENRKRLYSAIAAFFSSGVVAFVIVQLSVTWMLVCGTTVPSFAVLSAALAAGSATAGFIRLSPRRYADLLLAATVIAAMCFVAALINQTYTLGVSVFDNSSWLPFLLPGTCVTAIFGLTLFWAVQSALRTVAGDTDDSGFQFPHVSETAAGLGFGFLLALTHGLAPFPMAVTVSILVATAAIVRFMIAESSDSAARNNSQGFRLSTAALSSVGAGVLCQCMAEFGTLQFPLSASVLCTASAMTLVMALLMFSKSGQHLMSRKFSVVVWLTLLASIPFASHQAVALNLHLNAGIESGLTVLLLRALQLAILFTLVIGCALSFQLAFSRRLKHNHSFMAAVGIAAAFFAGVSVGALMSLIDLRAGITLGILLVAAPGILYPMLSASESAPAKPPVRTAFASLCLCCAVVATMLPVASDNAMLLFTSHSAQAWRMGFRLEQIAQTHSMRLLEDYQTSSGRLSVWRTYGDRIQIRRNGIPTAEATTNCFTSPQPVADSLTAILPLVMHQNATSVLLLGDDSGAGLRACSDFPLHTIRAVRADVESTKIASKTVWGQMDPPPANDDRIAITHGTPAAAIRRHTDRQFDVIAADSPPPTAAAAQSCFTFEFYAAARRRLNADGVFCQRLTTHEFGADLLLRSLSSLTRIFDRVVIVRMAPGELAIVAGNANLLDAQLLKRMQKSHVNTALSRSGWDWSQVAALPVVDTGDPFGILEHMEKRKSSSASNGYFAFALPNETMRLSDKAAEVRAAFAPHQQRLADAAPRGAAYSEFARRFSAVVQQAEILTAFPDIPWPYRKSLKMEMQRNPRAPIESVRDGQIVRNAHPLDEHRKRYFLTLSTVVNQAKTGTVDPNALRQLSQFTLSYEPLLSHFAHHELIRVHESTSHPSPAMELRHRLYTVYFTEPKDLSVRQVTGAIEQILDDPELLPGDAERFDHVNSMLQELVRRWEGRRGADPASARRTQRDVDVCMQVAGRALSALEKWAPTLNITPDQIRLRRRFVNMKLVAPLREYRDQILAHRIRTEVRPAEPEMTPNDDELPLLLDPNSMMTN